MHHDGSALGSGLNGLDRQLPFCRARGGSRLLGDRAAPSGPMPRT